MKKIRSKKSAEGLASLLSNAQGNNPAQTSDDKIVVADECGDTLWDDVLKQDEKNLAVESNKGNTKLVD